MSKDTESVITASTAASQLIEADPYLVAFSLTNTRRRKGLDIDSLNSLAASIKAQGLAQPILVRPLPGSRAEDTFASREDGQPLPTFELICGERRLRACRIAELPTIPMLVRDLDDEAALELQLVENIEREDLDPIEEAEGFELLRSKLGYTVEQIAERIAKGKGISYVRKTMKLLSLTPASRDAMYEGHLGRSTGLLVARYPEGQQAEVVDFIKGLASNGEPAPYREVAPKVHTRFNLDLKKAVWILTDADLVPAAGACSDCPKRTGVHADLFGDDANTPDSCTDPDCFETKRAAHVERVKAQAQKDGFKVIDGDEAKKAVSSPFQTWIGGGYTRLTDTAYTEEGNDGTEREVTFEDALRAKGKKAPKPRVLIHPFTGEAIKVITSDLADKLQEEAPEPAGGKQPTRHVEEEDDDNRPEEQKALDDYQVRRAVLLRMFDAVRNRDRTDADMLLIAKALFGVATIEDALSSLEKYLNWDADLENLDYEEAIKIVHAKLDAMPAAEVAAVITMAAVEVAFSRYGFSRELEVAIAAAYRVDVLAVRDKVAEDLERQENGDADVEAGTADEDQPTGEATEPEPYIGARVRMKDDLRSGGGKRRKISGREAVLQAQVIGDSDSWMVQCDGSKEKTRVERHEFVVLAADGEAADPEGEETVETKNWPLPANKASINPLAAWPFPKATEDA
jgi:ParB/RepB/Spo0J family partition protein